MNLYKLAKSLRARATRIEKRLARVTDQKLAHELRLDVKYLRRLAYRCDPRLRRVRGRRIPDYG